MDHIEFTTPYMPSIPTSPPSVFDGDGDDKKHSIKLNSYMDVIKFLMFTRDTAQILHWATYKFSVHMAMGELYDGLEEMIDDLAEMMLGSVESMDFASADTESYQMSKQPSEFIETVRSVMIDSAHLFVSEPSLKNKFDEIVGLINKTKYKIDRLVS